MHLQWRWLDAAIQWNIKLFDIKIGFGGHSHWILRIVINSPVTTPDQLMPLFVNKSTFRPRSIVHPTGGGAAKLVCEQCGAEYPYVANPCPCSFCAVMKESGLTINIGHRTREWRWSEWGWAIKHNGYYVGEHSVHPMPPAITVTKFNAKHKALEAAALIEKQEWLELDPPHTAYTIEVGPYPLKPVQPAPDGQNIVGNIMASKLSPGIGAKPGTMGTMGTIGRKSLKQ